MEKAIYLLVYWTTVELECDSVCPYPAFTGSWLLGDTPVVILPVRT